MAHVVAIQGVTRSPILRRVVAALRVLGRSRRRAGLLLTRLLALTATPKVAREPSRLVVVLDDASEAERFSDPGCPGISAVPTADYSPAANEWIYWPSSPGEALSREQLRNVLLAVQACAYDVIAVSHSLDDPPPLQVVTPRNALVVSSRLWKGWRERLALPRNPDARILRLLPAPAGAQLQALDPASVGIAHAPADADASVGRQLTYPLLRPRPDPRPLVFVLPAAFAVGGVERNTVEVMRRLSERYRFVVVTNERHEASRGSLHHQLVGLADDVYDLAEIAPPRRHLELLVRLTEDYRPYCFWICNGSVWLSLNARALRAAFAEIPIVDQQVYDTDHGWIEWFHDPGILAFDRFIAINRKIRDTFTSRYGIPPERIDLIYHAVDAERFTPGDDPQPAADWRRALDIPPGANVFCEIGRLHPQKRPQDFLELARRSGQAGNDDVFVLVGDGPLAAECRDMAERASLTNLRLLPYCEDVKPAFAAMSGLVITSAYEGLPIVALEAMSMGVPVLASDVGDLRVVLEEHDLGTIFGLPGDLEALWQVFSEWRSRLPELATVSRRAAPGVRERFSSRVVAEEYAACFERAGRGLARGQRTEAAGRLIGA